MRGQLWTKAALTVLLCCGCAVTVKGTSGSGPSSGFIYFENNSPDDVRIALESYASMWGTRIAGGGVFWVFGPYQRSFLLVNNRAIAAQQAVFTLTSRRGTVIWHSAWHAYRNIGGTTALVLYHSPPAQYGEVVFHNASDVSVKLTCDYYVDPNGVQRTVGGHWIVPAGAEFRLSDDSAQQIFASTFSFSLEYSSGRRGSWTSTDLALRGGTLRISMGNQELSINSRDFPYPPAPPPPAPGGLATPPRFPRPPALPPPSANSVEVTREQARDRAVGKILGALGFELLRRGGVANDSKAAEYAGTIGRNYFVESALTELLPDAPPIVIGVMTRYLGAVAQNEASLGNLAEQTVREALIVKLTGESPALTTKLAAQFVELLYDLSRKPRGR